MLDSTREKLNRLSALNRGQYPEADQEKKDFEQKVKDLEKSKETFVGTRQEIAANDKKVATDIVKLKNEFFNRNSEAIGKLWTEVQKEVNEYYDVTNNPKVSLLWSKADERGHSAGHSEIVSVFGDLVDLIK